MVKFEPGKFYIHMTSGRLLHVIGNIYTSFFTEFDNSRSHILLGEITGVSDEHDHGFTLIDVNTSSHIHINGWEEVETKEEFIRAINGWKSN